MPNINTLAAGAYWYVECGKAPVICEKRAGEAFIRFTNGGRQSWCREDDRFEGPLPSPATPGGLPAVADAEFQDRTSTWAGACFGELIAGDQKERAQRFVEEALELAQASGIPREEVLQLVDYVFGRPAGQFEQEVGGVLTTLALLCAARQVRMTVCGETELARVWDKIEAIRAKQAAKPPGSPLPIAVQAPSAKGMSKPTPAALDSGIGERLRTIREALGMTQSDLASALCVTDRTIKRYEAGTSTIPSDVVVAMMGIGMDIAYLFGVQVPGAEEKPQERQVDTEVLQRLAGTVDSSWSDKDSKGAPCELTPSQVNHLRRLLGWVRCEAGQEPEALVRTVKTILPALVEQPSAEAQKRLVVAHDAAMKVPRYVWAGIKALSRVTGEHLDLEDEEDAKSLSDEEVSRFWSVFKNDRSLMDEFDAFAGTARDIFDAKGTR